MQRAAAAVLAAVAVTSTGLGLARVWPELGRQHDRYASWSDERVAHAPALHERLPTAPFDLFRRALAGREVRYYVDVPVGGPGQLLTTRSLVYRTFATYWLLPSVPVADPREADVVLGYRADVRRLGLRYARVERPAPRVTIAWTAPS